MLADGDDVLYFANLHTGTNGPAGRRDGTLSVSHDGGVSWVARAGRRLSLVAAESAWLLGDRRELDDSHLGVLYETTDESGAGGIVFKVLEKPKRG